MAIEVTLKELDKLINDERKRIRDQVEKWRDGSKKMSQDRALKPSQQLACKNQCRAYNRVLNLIDGGGS